MTFVPFHTEKWTELDWYDFARKTSYHEVLLTGLLQYGFSLFSNLVKPVYKVQFQKHLFFILTLQPDLT